MTRYSTGMRTRWKRVLGIAAVLLTLLFFLSPVVTWVAAVTPAWWWPFVAWGLVIALIAAAREPAIASSAESLTSNHQDPREP